MQCPICAGTGTLPKHLKTMPMEVRRSLTKTLFAAGYNQVEIMRIVGWSSLDKVRKTLLYDRSKANEERGRSE